MIAPKRPEEPTRDPLEESGAKGEPGEPPAGSADAERRARKTTKRAKASGTQSATRSRSSRSPKSSKSPTKGAEGTRAKKTTAARSAVPRKVLGRSATPAPVTSPEEPTAKKPVARKTTKRPVKKTPEPTTKPAAKAGTNGSAPLEEPREEPRGSLAWHPAPSVPQTIRASFDEAIAFANLMVDRAPEHPSLSVHEYRKTIRRMRALVRLLRGIIDRETLRSIDSGLRAAVLPTSGLRDARILLATLERVPPISGSKHLRHALEERWQGRIHELEASDEEQRVLAQSRAPLARLPQELADALPITISEEDLREAMRRSYRRARRVVRTAMRVPEDASIHRARKRIKELRYQLEWLVDVSAKRTRTRQKLCARLAQDLGEVTDFLVLEESILDDRTGLRGLKPKRFCRRLRRILLARFEEVSVEMEALFTEPSRDFVRGVAAKLGEPSEEPPKS